MNSIHIKRSLILAVVFVSGFGFAQEQTSAQNGNPPPAASKPTAKDKTATTATAKESDAAEEAGRKQEAREQERRKWRHVRKEYRRTSGSTKEGIRLLAINLLDGIDYIRAAERLVERILEDRSEPVAERAMDLLAKLKSDEVVEYVIRSLGGNAKDMNLGDPRLLHLAEALARMDNPMVLPTLKSFVKRKDKRYQILGLEGLANLSHPDPKLLDLVKPFLRPGHDFALQLSAVRAISNIPTEDAVKLLVAMARRGGRIQEEAVKGLMRLTGASVGADVKMWDKWLQNATNDGQDPLALNARRAAQRPLDNMDFSAGNGYSFFGIPVNAKRVFFVLDRSGSMRGRPLQRVKNELVKLIRKLDRDVSFNIMFYNQQLSYWRPTGLFTADIANKNSAINFIMQIQAQGGTYTKMAMLDVLQRFGEKEQLETICLLSDGQPTDGRPLQIASAIRSTNRFLKIRINTIGYFGKGQYYSNSQPQAPQGTTTNTGKPSSIILNIMTMPGTKGNSKDILSTFMRTLAEQNYGRFVELQ